MRSDDDLRKLPYFVDHAGREPFREWLEALLDSRAREVVKASLDRLRLVLVGHCRALGSSVHELKIDVGPGYRIYFGNDGEYVVLILVGGSKQTQGRDIGKAKRYWQAFKDSQEGSVGA